MSTLYKTVLICAALSVAIFNAILIAYDFSTQSAIAEAKEREREILVEDGVSSAVIEKELLKLEKRLQHANQWEQSTYKDFVKTTVYASILGVLLGGFVYAFFIRRIYIKTQLAIIIVLSLVPALWQAYLFVTDARGLITLSSMNNKDFSFNPYVSYGGFISPVMASTIYIHYPMLYKNCGLFSKTLGQCDTPIVFFIGNSLDIGDNEAKERQYNILKSAIARGESLTATVDGLAPIHQAVLFNNPRYAAQLIRSGADIKQKINNPDTPLDGLSAVEFLNYLEQKEQKDFTRLRAILLQKGQDS